MSYTPKTWSNGDVINATDLNKIEQGIANAQPSGVEVVIVYYPNSTVGWQVDGDFASCLAKVQQGIPILALQMSYNSSSGWFSSRLDFNLAVYYSEEYPNQIDLQITGGVGLIWTQNGVEYYD